MDYETGLLVLVFIGLVWLYLHEAKEDAYNAGYADRNRKYYADLHREYEQRKLEGKE